jgi:Fe-S cluster assembly iron-binding protein IscA
MSLTLTTKAIKKLEAELERKRTKPNEVFRLIAGSSGDFGMRLDEPTAEDVVLRHEGTPLLAFAPGLADRLADAALDVGQAADEPEWVLVRGGATS